jgi:hypothetical protein
LEGVPASPYNPAQLDQLLAPVALYPDPLVALILPGSTAPSDIVAAAQYLAANGDPNSIDAQPWDPSVRGLAHYPALLEWLAGNLQWTQALGLAFAQQPADVMQAIQRLRARALAAGTLVSTPQQQVIVDGGTIRIVPAQQDAVYLPEYDPNSVYDSSAGYAGPAVSFGIGYPVGAWLGYECDWDDFGIWVGPWHPGWAYRRDWQNPGQGGAAWRPDPRQVQEGARNFPRPQGSVPSPRSSVGSGPERHPAPRPRLAIPVSPNRPADQGRAFNGNANSPSHAAASGVPSEGNAPGIEVRRPVEHQTEHMPAGHSAPAGPVVSPSRSAAPSPAPDDGRDPH